MIKTRLERVGLRPALQSLSRAPPAIMSFQAWQEGGCSILADLYPGETFISYEQACGDLGWGGAIIYIMLVYLTCLKQLGPRIRLSQRQHKHWM